MSKERGSRYNTDKPKLSLVDEAPTALCGVAQVLMKGMEKYSRSNWKKGLLITEILDSMRRHMVAFTNGENNCKESGQPHVDHITANALFLAEMFHTRPDMDDRVPVPGAEKEFKKELLNASMLLFSSNNWVNYLRGSQ